MWVVLAIWIGLCAAAFGTLLVLRPRFAPDVPALVVIAAVAIVTRFVPILLYPEPKGFGSIDVLNYHLTATAVLDRRDVYTLLPIGIYPYPPLHLYVFAAAKAISDTFDISFFMLVRIPQALADVGVAVVVADIVRRARGIDAGWRAGLLYAVCPLPILTTVYHGQFDAVSVLFAVSAYWAFIRGHAQPAFFTMSAAALALGSLEKVWPALLLPIILVALPTNSERIRYVAVIGAICTAVVVLYIAAFGSSVERIYTVFADYRPIFARLNGLGLVVDRTFDGDTSREFHVWFMDHGRQLSLGAALIANAVAILLRLPLARAIVLVLCTIFLTSPEAHAYHLLWIIPFALVLDDRPWVGAMVALSGTSYAIGLLIGGGMFLPAYSSEPARWMSEHTWLLEYAVWLVFAAWAGSTLVRGRLRAPLVGIRSAM